MEYSKVFSSSRTLFVFVALGALNWNHNPFVPFIPEGQTFFQSLGFGIAIAIWIYSGYESMSTMAGELQNPQVIPRATLLSVPAVIATYTLPIVFGLAAYGNYSEWSADTGINFVTIIGSYGIPGLVLIFVLGAVFCNLSLYNSYLASSSRGFFVIAEDKLAPPILCKVNKKYGTPHIAIFSMAILNLIFVQFGFAALVIMDVILFMFSYLLWFFAIVALRIKEPDLPRPFKIPLGVKGLIVMIIAPTIICVTAFFTNGINYLLGGSLGILSGPIAYVIFKRKYGGLNGSKILSRSQKMSMVLLSLVIVVCFASGLVLLNNESNNANASFNDLYHTYLYENYEIISSSYNIIEDSFVLKLADKTNENASTNIWYYYGDLTGDIYLYDSFADEMEFAQSAFMVTEQIANDYLSSVYIYSDDYEFYFEAGEEYTSPEEIYNYLVE